MYIKCSLGIHAWVGCLCSRCNKEQHDFTKDCGKCSKCGITKENRHNWEKGICLNCGKKEEKKAMTLSEVINILVKLYDESPKGEGFLRSSPQAKTIKDIGELLNNTGGLRLMQQAHTMFSQERYNCARNLEMVWHGIGEWYG
jgi:hypothetical protein